MRTGAFVQLCMLVNNERNCRSSSQHSHRSRLHLYYFRLPASGSRPPAGTDVGSEMQPLQQLRPMYRPAPFPRRWLTNRTTINHRRQSNDANEVTRHGHVHVWLGTSDVTAIARRRSDVTPLRPFINQSVVSKLQTAGGSSGRADAYLPGFDSQSGDNSHVFVVQCRKFRSCRRTFVWPATEMLSVP